MGKTAEFEFSEENKLFSSILDTGKGKQRTWKRWAWKAAGYSALAAAGIIIIAGL